MVLAGGPQGARRRDQLADQGIGQEDDGKKLLQTLLDGKPGEASYDDALEKFVAAAREHIDYEQQVVWPRFESAVSRDELERLGQRLEQAHKIAPTRPHPHTPSSSVVQKTMGVVAATVDRVVDAATGRDKNHPPDSAEAIMVMWPPPVSPGGGHIVVNQPAGVCCSCVNGFSLGRSMLSMPNSLGAQQSNRMARNLSDDEWLRYSGAASRSATSNGRRPRRGSGPAPRRRSAPVRCR